ncbi:MAG: hypothetical protein OXU36_18345 [Candidatus Poribacteria bacterium]|nr:hypothetical protein [Candidatus Poribacteria bacterium]
MRGVITAPANIISGAFNIHISFPSEADLAHADIFIETLEGDALGHEKDTFTGGSNHYHLICYLPDDRKGKSRIHVLGHEVKPVDIEYDTIRSVILTWGTPSRSGKKTDIPFTLSDAVVNLRKQNFKLSKPARKVLYGTGNAYQLIVSMTDDFNVTSKGTVEKENGIVATLTAAVIEVEV